MATVAKRIVDMKIGLKLLARAVSTRLEHTTSSTPCTIGWSW